MRGPISPSLPSPGDNTTFHTRVSSSWQAFPTVTRSVLRQQLCDLAIHVVQTVITSRQ
jgi:hypothetical protein